jgi:hypothetical protein
MAEKRREPLGDHALRPARRRGCRRLAAVEETLATKIAVSPKIRLNTDSSRPVADTDRMHHCVNPIHPVGTQKPDEPQLLSISPGINSVFTVLVR